MAKRPIYVTIIAWVYIVTGAVGFVYHLTGFQARPALAFDAPWIELVRLTAVLCGVYLLFGRNWARWLALAWMAFHVVVSAFHTLPEMAIHAVFLAVLAYLLTRPAAVRYFRPA
jgi:hypothetical protein